MGFFQEFRQFAIKGNVVDMAVGIIIGAAFGKIVSSLVSDIITPPIGLLAGGVDFTSLFISLSGGSYPSIEAAQAAGAPTLNYGRFLQHAFDFLIVALAVFILVKVINAAKRKAEEKPTEDLKPAQDIVLLTEIRDLLKRR
jgi:large conductance mechanosensitive channel